MKFEQFLLESQQSKTDLTQTPEFKKWFGKSKIVDKSGNPLVVYHATNKEFNEFKFKGEKLTSLGIGFYFTPSLTKAKQYGDIVMKVYLSAEKVLDWNNLTDADRKLIIKTLNHIGLDDNDIAGYGTPKSKKFHKDDIEESKKFFAEMKAKTKSYFHDRAKAKVKKEGDYFIVSWMEAGLDGARDVDLLALIQRYDNDFAEHSGYDAVMYHDEIAVFKPNQIKSVDNKGTFSKTSNNIFE